jgi:DNA-binding CsgD family transcriptional regulator
MGEQTRFSEREQQVIELLVQGKSNKQIALALGISQRTVEFHLSNIYAKLGVSSRTEAALRLNKTGLRESTGTEVRQTTVPPAQESGHNPGTSISRKRIPMNKSFIAGVGVLLITSIFCITALFVIVNERAAAEYIAAVTADTTRPVTPVAETLATAEPGPTSTLAVPAPTRIAIAPHTVNGYTAAIESYYVDTSHVIFQVRITGGDVAFGDEHYYDRIESPDLFDETGNAINTSGGFGPAVDPELYQFEFVPLTLFQGDRLKGQFGFALSDAPDYEEILAQFRFDFDLPMYPETRFYPKQTVTANGMEILLDSVTVTPVFTQLYLCFPPPSFAPWTLGSQTVLQLDQQQAPLYNFRLLFGADLGGDRRAGSEPYWAPPTENGRCMKIGFPVGSSNPTALRLSIPALTQEDPEALLSDRLLRDYPGLSAKDAYQAYLEEHDKTFRGPWLFTVQLNP